MNTEMHEQKQAISLFSLCTGIYRPSARGSNSNKTHA